MWIFSQLKPAENIINKNVFVMNLLWTKQNATAAIFMTYKNKTVYANRWNEEKISNIPALLFPCLQHLLRRVLENQHKLIQLLQQQQTRLCSTGRLQEAIKPQDDQDFPQLKTIDASISYYPVNQPFVHAQEVGDQFSVSFHCLRVDLI